MKYAFFHYNKPASQQAGEPRLSVHWKDRCHIVSKVSCRASICTRHRNTQPRCVMAGKASKITFTQDTAFIE